MSQLGPTELIKGKALLIEKNVVSRRIEIRDAQPIVVGQPLR
jgi:hypothetical protein